MLDMVRYHSSGQWNSKYCEIPWPCHLWLHKSQLGCQLLNRGRIDVFDNFVTFHQVGFAMLRKHMEISFYHLSAPPNLHSRSWAHWLNIISPRNWGSSKFESAYEWSASLLKVFYMTTLCVVQT